MFIIFGSPRSGTTLLSSILNSHSDVLIPDETDFIVPILFIFDRIKDPNAGKNLIKNLITSSTRFPFSIGEYISKEEVFKIIDDTEYVPSDILNSIYQFMATKHGKKIGADKSPNDLFNFHMFLKEGVFDSDIKIIHIVRDVRDVFLSIRKTRFWLRNIEFCFPRKWSESNLLLYNVMKGNSKQYFFIKYEDLIGFPEDKLKEISKFIGIPFEKEILNFERRINRHQGEAHHLNVNKPFLEQRIGVWKKEMDRVTREMCETQAKECLELFKY